MHQFLYSKLEKLEEKFEELEKILADPSIWQNQKQTEKLSKEHSELKDIVEKFRRYRELERAYRENQEQLAQEKDEELKELFKEEIQQQREELDRLEKELQILLLPKDPNDERNVILEIRAGTGGEEAALFAAELLRMYRNYAEKKGWKTEIISASETGLKGYKEVIVQINGRGAYSRLKFESGVHRVQRVPVTETQGRIHTSAVTVAVLPEAQEVDVQIDEKDLRIETFRSSGPGGQHVNTTDSAVRITHLPTGLVVSCQDEKSQHKNKAKALKILRSRLYELELKKQREREAQMRRSMVGSGDRSEKIRTYNFPQGRVTDHRIGLTLYQLDSILSGDLDPIIDPLISAMQTEALQRSLEEEGSSQ